MLRTLFGFRKKSSQRERPSREASRQAELDLLLDGHRPPDAEGLSSQLLGLARHLLEAEGIVILKPATPGWRVTLASPGFNPVRSLPRVEGLLAMAWENEKEVTAASVSRSAVGHLGSQRGNVSLVILPLSQRGRSRALLACHRASGRPFLDREIALLKKCARILGGWESFAAHAQALSEARDQEERLARGIERMLSETDPLEIAGHALDALFDLLPAVQGYVVIQSATANYSGLMTKRFKTPERFRYPERATWAYWVMTRGRESLYLEGAASRDTAMPILYEGEPFPPGGVALLLPLESSGELFGVAGLIGKPDLPFAESGRGAAERFVRQVSALMTVALLNKLNQESALQDALTGLYNRRYFDERLDAEVKRSQRSGQPVSLVLTDIDHFKRINDTYGHPAGDATLREVAQKVKSAVRSVDVVCRYGGEEMAIILPACAMEEACEVAERSRKAVESTQGGHGLAFPEAITLSAGVASCPVPFTTPTGLTKAADAALYEAKRKGRNRVEAARR